MLAAIFIYFSLGILLIVLSLLTDLTDSRIGIKSWYRRRRQAYPFIAWLDRLSPHRIWKRLIKFIAKYPRTTITLLAIGLFHVWLHLSNPYASINFVQQPYTTAVQNGQINYHQHHQTFVFSDSISDLVGYYRQGFLIVQNTFFGGKKLDGKNSQTIIDKIHDKRFDASKPYLISGDQFSVLYPRNLGVFYNQLLDPNTAHDPHDWEQRQRIYLQSTLYAIDGLSVGRVPKTTLVPIGPRSVIATTVHPGDIASDAVYGTLYALDRLSSQQTSRDGKYKIQTNDAATKILLEKSKQLRRMVANYVDAVRDDSSGLVRSDIKLSSARDGVSRQSSFYDNIVYWKTLDLADKLGIYDIDDAELQSLKNKINQRYWNQSLGYYQNDLDDKSFSSDFLIGYPTGFFDLQKSNDRTKAKQIISYINDNQLADPLPIKYQIGRPEEMPFIIRKFVPIYGGEAIWSYWGAQYITLLADMCKVSREEKYCDQASEDIKNYQAAIVRDGGFAETFNPDGTFLRVGPYKSIRVTGWVVQFEHAIDRLKQTTPASQQ